MLLSCMEMACTLPLAIFSVYINNHGVQMVKWVSWADTHFNFSFVQMVPAEIWKHNNAFRVSVEMSRWIFPACALVFFLLFGFADEARRNYRSVFDSVVSMFRTRRTTINSKGKECVLFFRDTDTRVLTFGSGSSLSTRLPWMTCYRSIPLKAMGVTKPPSPQRPRHSPTSARRIWGGAKITMPSNLPHYLTLVQHQRLRFLLQSPRPLPTVSVTVKPSHIKRWNHLESMFQMHSLPADLRPLFRLS